MSLSYKSYFDIIDLFKIFTLLEAYLWLNYVFSHKILFV